VAWDAGETGCSYDVYYSRVNCPVNLGHLLNGPAPVSVGVNALTATLNLPALSSQDNSTDYATLAGAWDAAVNTAKAAFAVGGDGFFRCGHDVSGQP